MLRTIAVSDSSLHPGNMAIMATGAKHESECSAAASGDRCRKRKRSGSGFRKPRSGRGGPTAAHHSTGGSEGGGCPMTASANAETCLCGEGAGHEAVCYNGRGLGHFKRDCPSSRRCRPVEHAIECLQVLKANKALNARAIRRSEKGPRRGKADTKEGCDGARQQRGASSVEVESNECSECEPDHSDRVESSDGGAMYPCYCYIT